MRFLALLTLLVCSPLTLFAQSKADLPLTWIWTDDATLDEAPQGTRYFRKTFPILRGCDEAVLDITADDAFTVWVNALN